jgi:hypothetical protein
MKRIWIVIGIAALLTPAAALANDPAGQETSPAQWCKQELTRLGEATFKQTYGTNLPSRSNAFGKCVAKKTREAEANHANASTQCRAEQQDTTFAAGHGGKTFDQFYGTGKSGKNAFGRCVSSKAQAAAAGQSQAILKAAKKCKTERAADAVAFKAHYGSNKDKSNAFGKCVAHYATSA